MLIMLLLSSICICNVAQFLPPTKSVVTLEVLYSCLSQTGNELLLPGRLWLSFVLVVLFFATPHCHKCHFMCCF